MKKLLFVPLFLLLGACTLVRITPAGDNVAVLQPSQVTNCAAEGSITVAVISKVVVNREPEKVAQELRTLARNRAADRGDTLVAAGPPANGEQTFNIYRCRR